MKRTSILLLLILLLLGILGIIALIGSSAGFLLIVIPAFLIWLFVWILPAVLKRVDSKEWIATGLLILIGLIFPTSLLMSRGYEMGPFSTLTSTIIFLLPSLALVNAAVLLFSGLSRRSSGMGNDKITVVSFVLSALLLIKVLHNIYDLMLWDSTYDPLNYLWLIIPIFMVLLSGLMLFIALPYRTKPVGIFYVLIVPVLLVAVSAIAQSVDFHQETARRAQRTVQAIESYYESNGRYPESLSQLRPRHILSLPKPMVIYGQDWCYEGGDDYYRLGYIDRKHWSDPNLIGRVHTSVGEVSDLPQICITEFAAIQKDQPDYPYAYSMEDR
ncbi:MAG TPA: hypothetical protein VK851_03150 [Anaerolineales bacterium]|nr:hypothetical protein [Anaerolineales bacterium]